MLNVPYKEKDIAKLLGAKFDWEVKTWYCDDISNIEQFSKWLNEANIICENLYVLKMQRECSFCGKRSEVLLLATDRSYSPLDNYHLNTDLQILTYVEWMPRQLMNMLETMNYYPSYSRTMDYSYFMNHCTNCKKTHGDFFLHEKPDEAIYKHLIYKDAKPCTYSKISSDYLIPIKAKLPEYDKVNSSLDLLYSHLLHPELENRASVSVDQKTMNLLLKNSIKNDDTFLQSTQ